MWAGERGHVDVVKLLLANKADINLKNKVCLKIFTHETSGFCVFVERVRKIATKKIIL